ncbi:hypothetical protein DPMN_051014 [Dreissena polymorpha]|uniref:Uncharacterized protein n=1 Tax=Dreissena polymorpha TaxID=45954 RepID=A0A9D4CH54_DREPO|nr:hypothetical protein DPMN_051014 [Dreissena polymorpha]
MATDGHVEKENNIAFWSKIKCFTSKQHGTDNVEYRTFLYNCTISASSVVKASGTLWATACHGAPPIAHV